MWQNFKEKKKVAKGCLQTENSQPIYMELQFQGSLLNMVIHDLGIRLIFMLLSIQSLKCLSD